jgi:hypothetical protein
VLLRESHHLGALETKAEQPYLRVELRLLLSLGRPGRWKVVPLVGRSAVMLSARAKTATSSVAISTAIRRGYHVWVTKQSGDVELTMQLIIAAQGPRAALEHDVAVARTAVTTMAIELEPLAEDKQTVPRVRPRLRAAVSTGLRTVKGSQGKPKLRFDAVLRPTTRIRLTTHQDLAVFDGSSTPSKLFARALHLLSVEQGRLELFSVVRYTILYAPTKHFQLLIPRGLKVAGLRGWQRRLSLHAARAKSRDLVARGDRLSHAS